MVQKEDDYITSIVVALIVAYSIAHLGKFKPIYANHPYIAGIITSWAGLFLIIMLIVMLVKQPCRKCSEQSEKKFKKE